MYLRYLRYISVYLLISRLIREYDIQTMQLDPILTIHEPWRDHVSVSVSIRCMSDVSNRHKYDRYKGYVITYNLWDNRFFKRIVMPCLHLVLYPEHLISKYICCTHLLCYLTWVNYLTVCHIVANYQLCMMQSRSVWNK